MKTIFQFFFQLCPKTTKPFSMRNTSKCTILSIICCGLQLHFCILSILLPPKNSTTSLSLPPPPTVTAILLTRNVNTTCNILLRPTNKLCHSCLADSSGALPPHSTPPRSPSSADIWSASLCDCNGSAKIFACQNCQTWLLWHCLWLHFIFFVQIVKIEKRSILNK